MKKTLIFCTAYIDPSKNKYKYSIQKWIDWTKHYQNLNLQYDLYMFHDGKLKDTIKQELKQKTNNSINIIEVIPHLGRKSIANFPGCIRSHIEGLRFGLKNNYFPIVHIESDNYLTKKGKTKLINIIKDKSKTLIYSGYSRKYNFMETTLVLYKNKSYIQHTINQFKDNYESKIIFEHRLVKTTQPRFYFKGQRIEKPQDKPHPDSDYFLQVSYNKFKKIKENLSDSV